MKIKQNRCRFGDLKHNRSLGSFRLAVGIKKNDNWQLQTAHWHLQTAHWQLQTDHVTLATSFFSTTFPVRFCAPQPLNSPLSARRMDLKST